MIAKAIATTWFLVVLVFMVLRPSLTPPGRPDQMDAAITCSSIAVTSLYAIFSRSRWTIWAMLIAAFVGMWVAWESNTRLPLALAYGAGIRPYVVWWIAVCGWIFIMGRLGPAIVWGVQDKLEKRREGRCLHCGYDLRATPKRCPECGRDQTTEAM